MRLLPSMVLVFASYSLRSGAVLLNNSAAASPHAAASKSAAAQVLAAQLQDPVVEIRIESFMVRVTGLKNFKRAAASCQILSADIQIMLFVAAGMGVLVRRADARCSQQWHQYSKQHSPSEECAPMIKNPCPGDLYESGFAANLDRACDIWCFQARKLPRLCKLPCCFGVFHDTLQSMTDTLSKRLKMVTTVSDVESWRLWGVKPLIFARSSNR